jgi:dimethylargininase
VTALPDGTFIASDVSLFDPAPFPTMRLVPEGAGSDVILVGDGTIVMAASAPRSAAMFDDLGFDVITVDIGEFEKREGCVTCLSVLVTGRGTSGGGHGDETMGR